MGKTKKSPAKQNVLILYGLLLFCQALNDSSQVQTIHKLLTATAVPEGSSLIQQFK